MFTKIVFWVNALITWCTFQCQHLMLNRYLMHEAGVSNHDMDDEQNPSSAPVLNHGWVARRTLTGWLYTMVWLCTA